MAREISAADAAYQIEADAIKARRAAAPRYVASLDAARGISWPDTRINVVASYPNGIGRLSEAYLPAVEGMTPWEVASALMPADVRIVDAWLWDSDAMVRL